MDEQRRQALAKIGAVGLAGGLLLAGERAVEAASDTVENQNRWGELKPNRVYKSMRPGILIVTAVLYRKAGDFRAAIRGEVDGQGRVSASAGWGQAFGAAEGSFTMFVNITQRFTVKIIDDAGKTHGQNWDTYIIASGAFVPVG